MPDLLNLILSKSRDNCTFYRPERIFEFWSVKCFKKKSKWSKLPENTFLCTFYTFVKSLKPFPSVDLKILPGQ